MSGDLARMQQDDNSIVTAVLSANVNGLNTYESTVIRAAAAIEARQAIYAPLDICVDEGMQIVDCNELKDTLRAFYAESSMQDIQAIHETHSEMREGIEAAIEHEDKEREREFARNRKRRQRAAQSQVVQMAGANG